MYCSVSHDHHTQCARNSAHPASPDSAGTSAGVGFSIPIAIVDRVVPQLIQFGRIIRPALNVQARDGGTQSPSTKLP